jgi:hypothetical protein
VVVEVVRVLMQGRDWHDAATLTATLWGQQPDKRSQGLDLPQPDRAGWLGGSEGAAGLG